MANEVHIKALQLAALDNPDGFKAAGIIYEKEGIDWRPSRSTENAVEEAQGNNSTGTDEEIVAAAVEILVSRSKN